VFKGFENSADAVEIWFFRHVGAKVGKKGGF
jgi:hypothetical protein